VKLKDVKIGMTVIEQITLKQVKVIRIGITKHYGPKRPVQVRFADGIREYYAPKDLSPALERYHA
jgi:hypothetical protein